MPSFFQISKPFGELAGEGGGELTIARVGAARWREGWESIERNCRRSNIAHRCGPRLGNPHQLVRTGIRMDGQICSSSIASLLLYTSHDWAWLSTDRFACNHCTRLF